MRVAQARTEAVRRELTENAATGRERSGGLEYTDFHRPVYAELYEVIVGLVRYGAPHGPAVDTALEQDGKLAGPPGCSDLPSSR